MIDKNNKGKSPPTNIIEKEKIVEKPIFITKVNSFMNISLFLIVIICVFAIIYLINQNNLEIKTFYKFNNFKETEIYITPEKKKENYIKKAIFIFKKYKAKFTSDEQLLIANTSYDLSQETHISPYLLLAVGYEETKFNNDCVGIYGEITYLQYMPGTWRELTSQYLGNEKNVVYVTKIWYNIMENNLSDLSYINNITGYKDDLTERLLLSYNCGLNIMKTVKNKEDFKNLKKFIYLNKGIMPYDQKVLKRYNEFINLQVE